MKHRDLSLKKIFVFDWDGTLVNSMPTKFANFAQSFVDTCPYDLSHQQVLQKYKQYTGLPRVQVFQSLLSDFDLDFSPEIYERFTQALTEKNKESFRRLRLFPEVPKVLSRLSQVGSALYVSSSAPEAELEECFQTVMPADQQKLFRGFFGSREGFSKGKTHLARILQTESASPGEALVIGDDLHDYRLSQQAEVECLVIQRHREIDLPKEIPTMNSLEELLQFQGEKCGKL